MALDFVIWGIPASAQGKGGGVKRWQDRVELAAREAIPEESKIIGEDLSVLLIVFHTEDPGADLDNIAKPTLDGMTAVAFGDDGQIAQLTVRRTRLYGLSIADSSPKLTPALRRALDERKDFVYVRLDPAPDPTELP